jgi:hypothetical protein
LFGSFAGVWHFFAHLRAHCPSWDTHACNPLCQVVHKETYYSVKRVKRDLLQWQKRPTTCADFSRINLSAWRWYPCLGFRV